jgi:mRNA-degrading endonuclease RelE of RelBE toxin-antitoxin system
LPSYEVITLPSFEDSVRRLARRYRHVGEDVSAALEFLEAHPEQGVAIPGYAGALWKLRAQNRDVRGGKRGGYRLIYSWSQETNTVYMLLAYAKAQKADLTKGEIETLLQVLEEALAAEKAADEPPPETANEESCGDL